MYAPLSMFSMVKVGSIPDKTTFSSSVICLAIRHLSLQYSDLASSFLLACSYLRINGSKEAYHWYTGNMSSRVCNEMAVQAMCTVLSLS